MPVPGQTITVRGYSQVYQQPLPSATSGDYNWNGNGRLPARPESGQFKR
jgi:hypothetical protein